jgi:threonine dehydrogenase-like Zn-dependent dehydrogenase
MLRRLPKSVSDEAGALAEPLAVAVRAVERSGADSAATVCVLGAGPIGFMVVAALQSRGFAHVVVVEPNAARQASIRRMGVEACGLTHGADEAMRAFDQPPSVVIDCTGHPSGVPLAIELLRPHGVCVVVGMSDTPASADFAAIAAKELTITGSLAYDNRDFDEALRHLAEGHVPISNIVSGVHELSEAPNLFQELASRSTKHGKVLLRPNHP